MKNTLGKYALNVTMVLTITLLLPVATSSMASVQRDAGYWFAYTSAEKNGARYADRVSNVFHTTLGFSERRKRIREHLNGYNGFLGDLGAFSTREEAEKQKVQNYGGLPTFSVSDPLK